MFRSSPNKEIDHLAKQLDFTVLDDTGISPARQLTNGMLKSHAFCKLKVLYQPALISLVLHLDLVINQNRKVSSTGGTLCCILTLTLLPAYA